VLIIFSGSKKKNKNQKKKIRNFAVSERKFVFKNRHLRQNFFLPLNCMKKANVEIYTKTESCESESKKIVFCHKTQNDSVANFLGAALIDKT
jgi:hypothetical protein